MPSPKSRVRATRLGETALGVEAAGPWGVAQGPEVYLCEAVLAQTVECLVHQHGRGATPPAVGMAVEAMDLSEARPGRDEKK